MVHQLRQPLPLPRNLCTDFGKSAFWWPQPAGKTGKTQLAASQFRVERIVQSGDGKIERLTPSVYHFSRV
jgi:hypothetical protein